MAEMTFNGAEQHSLDWYRARLGNFTGSTVGKLMKSGRKKDEVFGDTAKSYIYEVAYERNLNPKVVEDDFYFQAYVDENNASSYAMRLGNEREPEARILYTIATGNKVEECPSVAHPTIEHFASSPDGYVVGDEKRICLEIKCMGASNYGKYLMCLKSVEDLKVLNDQYYWQCMAHMSVTGAQECHFFVYNPYCKKPYILLKIERNEEAIAQLEERVILANEYINQNTL